MEEDNGNLQLSLELLRKGCKYCSYTDVILIKAIKLHERLSDIDGARELLGNVEHEPIDKIWRIVLEGALIEARAGNIDIAREFFGLLMEKIPWYGPIYYEAFKIEFNSNMLFNAIDIITKGLQELPRYGPLWFGLINIMELLDIADEQQYWVTGERLPNLERLRKVCDNAVTSISRELVWKVHLERALAEERAATIAAHGRHYLTGESLDDIRNDLYAKSRECLLQSLVTCPANLRWKVLIAGARIELNANNFERVKALHIRAKQEVPEKSLYFISLEQSRFEEYLGNFDAARIILSHARKEFRSEWKICLETVMQEARFGNIYGAMYIADMALRSFPGCGRLWAILIQLSHMVEYKRYHFRSAIHKLGNHEHIINIPNELQDELLPVEDYTIPSKLYIVYRALCEVPKSGEVWCERARVKLNPLSLKLFDLAKSQRLLSFAIQFTPQYGDSFIEYIKVEILCQVILPKILNAFCIPFNSFLEYLTFGDYESDFYIYVTNILSTPVIEENCNDRDYCIEKITEWIHGNLQLNFTLNDFKSVSLESLIRRCVNADPNYGTAWIYCRERLSDTAATIINNAYSIMIHEILDAQDVYVTAIGYYVSHIMIERGKTVLRSPTSKFKSYYEPLLIKYNESLALDEDTLSVSEFSFDFSISNWMDDFHLVAGSMITTNDRDKSKTKLKECVLKLSDINIPIIEYNKNIYTSCDFITSLRYINQLLYTIPSTNITASTTTHDNNTTTSIMYNDDHYNNYYNNEIKLMERKKMLFSIDYSIT
jgi:hypothetical protein